MKIVTSVDLNEFLLALSWFKNLRETVDTVCLDNGSTFGAAADRLSSLLGSTELNIGHQAQLQNLVN